MHFLTSHPLEQPYLSLGFSCYWESAQFLWRITNCYFDVYDKWHSWSNVACVHRSQTNLSAIMETQFQSTLTNTLLDSWCGSCLWKSWIPNYGCADRLNYLKKTYKLGEVEAITSIIETGRCIKPTKNETLSSIR